MFFFDMRNVKLKDLFIVVQRIFRWGRPTHGSFLSPPKRRSGTMWRTPNGSADAGWTWAHGSSFKTILDLPRVYSKRSGEFESLIFLNQKEKLTTLFGPGLVLFESHLLFTVAWKAVSPMMRTRPEDP